ncbi:MAG: hypothetical protein CCU26_02765 [Nitrospira sp. UW-LDO-01]|nr:MAG: hypothetical protein CCU26_02765 [Nitrospira sp. UW-LDO-01]
MIGYGKRVLLFNDTRARGVSLVTMLEHEGFIVVHAQDEAQARFEMQCRHFDAVVADYPLPDLAGLDILRQLQMAWPETPVILFSEVDWSKCDMDMYLGTFSWIRKSPAPDILLSMLACAMDQKMTGKDVQVPELVGR